MKCRYCNSEWKTTAQMSVSIKQCPFCGKILAEEIKADTTEGVVATICRDYGEAELRNGKHLLAFFADLAPERKKDRLILSHFIACDGHTILLDAKKQNMDPKLFIERIVYKMTDELLLSEQISRQICEKYWIGIGGSALSQPMDSHVKGDAIPTTVFQPSKHTPPAKPNKTATPSIPSTIDFQIKGRTLVKYLGTSPNPCIPDGIRVVDKNAFKDNNIIETVTLPGTVTRIGEKAFNGCRKLHTVNLPCGLEAIGDYAFADSRLKSICLPDSLVRMGKYAFKSTEISRIRIPPQIATVSEGAFVFCKELREVELCPGVESVAHAAFDECPNLKIISIPDSLQKAPSRRTSLCPFRGTDNISSVIASDHWKKEHPDILRLLIPSPREEENFEIKGDVLLRYYGRAIRPQIPNGVAKIGEGAFEANSHMQGIVVPEGVHTISAKAFYTCRNLKMVTLPKTLMRIGEYAFGFTGLVSLSIPEKVYGVGDRAFLSCDRLKELTIPDGLLNIPATAFEWCRNIETINASNTWKSRNESLVSAIIKKSK